MFKCSTKEQYIHYSMLCNHMVDCEDKTDEHFCYFDSCTSEKFSCNNGQCVERNNVCSGVAECTDASDELCLDENDYYDLIKTKRSTHPSIVLRERSALHR